MNQAMNRWLRQQALLLLVPLLVASTPSSSAAPLPVGAGPAHHLTLTAPLGPVIAGVPVPVTVVVRDHGNNIATDFRGTIHFDTDADAVELPQNYTFTALDAGQKTFFITYKRVGPPKDLLIVDLSGLVIGVRIPNVPVQAGPARKFQFENVPPSTQAGNTISNIIVYALDEFDNRTAYTGSVRFTSNDPQAQLPAQGPLQNTYTVTFKSAGPGRTLRVTATEDTRITGEAILAVFPGPFRGVRMTPSATSLGACEEVTLEFRAMDAFGNTVSEARHVRHCLEAALPLTRTRTEFFVEEEAGNCISGHLPFSGIAKIGWKSNERQEVDFTLEDWESNSRTRIFWEEARPSAQTSTLSFPDATGTPPALRSVIGVLTVQVELRNACGRPAKVPPEDFSLAGTPPLAFGPPTSLGEGQWRVPVQLPECPASPSEPLALWPLIDHQPMTTANGTRFEQTLLPQCSNVLVRLSVRPRQEGTVAEPGALVEFMAELANEGQDAIPAGMLQLLPNGLTVLEARLEGQLLTRSGEGFELPELRPGMTQSVLLTAQASAQLDQPASAEVWYTTSDGIKLTPKQTVSFDREAPGVDVGCGCQAGDLPGQVGSWLLLLLAVSRPTERFRRLKRGERTYR